jgi:hypothetical protein
MRRCNLHRATRRSKIVEITYFCFFKEEEQNKATREKRPTEFLLFFVDVMGDLGNLNSSLKGNDDRMNIESEERGRVQSCESTIG